MSRDDLESFVASMNMSVNPVSEQDFSGADVPQITPSLNPTIPDENSDVVMNTESNIGGDDNISGDDESIVTNFCEITGSDRESGRHFLEVSD